MNDECRKMAMEVYERATECATLRRKSGHICEYPVSQLSCRRHLQLESCMHVRLLTITKLLQCRHLLLPASLQRNYPESFKVVSISYFFVHHIGLAL
jgi:hypothetical protein